MLTVKKKRLTYQHQIVKSKLHCCVPRCAVSSRYNSEVSFHRFPLQPEVRAQWLVRIRRDNFTPTDNTRVCGRHFKQEDFISTTKGCRKLVQGAVPCLFEWNNFCLSAPRRNVWERCPKRPSPPPSETGSDGEMEVSLPLEDSEISMPAAAPSELVEEIETWKQKVQELQQQIETLQLQSRFGLERLVGSDEDIRFYTR